MSRLAKIIPVLFLLVFGLGLTACGTTERGDLKQGAVAEIKNDAASDYEVFQVTMGGRTVDCIGWKYSGPDGKGATLQCDFAHSKSN